jgi:hypothetical protein
MPKGPQGQKRPAGDERAHTDGDYYGFFMTGLFGLLDDAEQAGYSSEGLSHLRAARDAFLREFHQRHPDQWSQPQISN